MNTDNFYLMLTVLRVTTLTLLQKMTLIQVVETVCNDKTLCSNTLIAIFKDLIIACVVFVQYFVINFHYSLHIAAKSVLCHPTSSIFVCVCVLVCTCVCVCVCTLE